jgi:hypothetical protein
MKSNLFATALVLCSSPSYAQKIGQGMIDKPLIDHSVTSHNQSGGITAHTVIIGPRRAEFDAGVKANILQKIPKDKPVELMAFGSQKDWLIGAAVAEFMANNGYQVRFTPNGVMIPAPEVPFAAVVGESETKFFVAPSAR